MFLRTGSSSDEIDLSFLLLKFCLIFVCIVSTISCTKVKEEPKSYTKQKQTDAPPAISNATGSKLAQPSRLIPSVALDDDGYFTVESGCIDNGSITGTCSVKKKASRPTVTCGVSGTVNERIADCKSKNSLTSQYDASLSDPQGGGIWNLVSFTDKLREVWQDSRTNLVWSDKIGDFSELEGLGKFNWCISSGNLQEDTLGLECRANTIDSFNNNSESLCAEDSTLQTPVITNDAKAGLAAASSVIWRLPGLSDWQQANRNGLRKILPHLDTWFWSATVSSVL